MSEQLKHSDAMHDGWTDALRRIEQARRDGAVVLDLSRLGLTEVPEEIGQLTQLQSLNLSFNQLTSLPNHITQLSHLRSLDIWDNLLTSLPDSIGQLSELQSLDLSHNGLNSLPDTIGQLIQLQRFYLSNNKIVVLPNSISQLSQLHYIDLHNNNLATLPESIRELTNLQEFYLHGNNQLKLPDEVLGPTWNGAKVETSFPPANPKHILDYYFRTRGGKRPLNEAKLILVGRGGVGKTSLVNRLVDDIFEKDEKKTEGIKITQWPLVLNKNENVRLNVWDFGGQEIMHATHQFFLTQRSLYLLVLNGREGNEEADAEYWLKLIESFGDESPVIVVLNKIGEHPFDVNRRALQQKYPNIREFIKTDCETGLGIQALNKTIERETDRLEHLRDAFPASWFQIKDQLAGMKKDYVTFEEFRDFCQVHGETDQGAQEALAGYLHNLGVVLNYKDDPRLEDTHVLSPHWVTDGIYKILNSPKLEAQKGEIKIRDLARVLDSRKYPPNMRCFIFDLMRKFDLCFSFPDDDTRYLIPELLDKQEPPETAEFRPEKCLNFQYHYPILPEGLLPRFIVRTHRLSEGLPRWRTGAILRFEGNRALVKADVQDRKVFISVIGPTAGRRRLLAVIRSEFERIHYDIRKLQPQEMIPLPDYPDTVVPYKKLLVLESHGEGILTEVVGNEIVTLNVHALLDGVDLDAAPRIGSRIIGKQAARLFFSYAHRDERLRDELETHLTLLRREGLIQTWHDRKIGAGDDWKKQIDDNLERADIVLLLVSADFIASDYCYEREMGRALERHRSGEARVIPVIVRDVDWQSGPLAELQALPTDGRAVTLWLDKDSAWRDVAEGIKEVARELSATKRLGRRANTTR